MDLSKPLLLDGPMGTEIDRLGGDTSLPLWSARVLLQNPNLVQQIHLNFLNAGSDIITTNTFRTQNITLQKAGYKDKGEELTKLAVQLAKNAISEYKSVTNRDITSIMVAGSISPIEDCYSPKLVPDDDILKEEHGLIIKWLYETKVDVFLVETMNTLREMKVVVNILQEYDLPIWVSFTSDDNGQILSGECWEDAFRSFNDKVDIFLVNCSSLQSTNLVIEKFISNKVSNWGLYPNFGQIDHKVGWRAGTVNLDEYRSLMLKWLEAKPAVIGTCCGATPKETVELRKLIDQDDIS